MSPGLENRDLLVEHVIERAKHGLSSTIIGLPGLAKGSLSQNIVKAANDREDIVSILLNTNAIPETNPYNIFYAIRKELLKKLTNAPPIEAYAYDDNFYKVIEDIHHLVFALGKEHKTLLMVFSKLAEYTAPKDVWENISALRSISDSIVVSFAFIDNPKLLRFDDGVASYGGLYDYIMNTVLWIKLSSRGHFNKEIHYWSEYYDYHFPEELQNFIWKQTGGHPALMKYMISYFFENSTIDLNIAAISENFALNTKLEHLISALGEHEKQALYEIAHSGAHSRINKDTVITALKNYDLVDDIDGAISIKIGLLQDFLLRDDFANAARIREKIDLPKLKQESTYDIKLNQGVVYIDGIKIEAEFSEREYQLLEYMISKRGQILSREDLGEVLWKDDSTDKYSDWSLDQTVSRIRKKLNDNGYKPKYIKTLRGRGFKLEF